jgi:hypothetical protein
LKEAMADDKATDEDESGDDEWVRRKKRSE